MSVHPRIAAQREAEGRDPETGSFGVEIRDYPALEGRPVTEAHVNVCRQRGHATRIVDNVEQDTCPRCGDVLSWGIDL